MSGEPPITVVGNLTDDPTLRFTPSGSAVANFTLACTPRTFNRQSNEWVDGETLFMPVSVWRDPAENVAESLTKGMRVFATGLLKSRSYEAKDGSKRTVMELEAEDVGPSLKFAKATVQRAQRGNQQGQGNRPAQSTGGQGGFGGNSAWTGDANAGNFGGNTGGGWGTGPDSEPPF